MTNDKLTAQIKDVGGIPVARVLPNRGKIRTVGAWCFLDRAGPVTFGDGEDGLQIGLHPHTNLQTFTWMLSGEISHQDSLGNQQAIRLTEVNLMTAGTGRHRGISHIEQTPPKNETDDRQLHAVQLWIALPMDKDIEPSFYHYNNLPTWTENGFRYSLTTGEFVGHQAETLQYSPLVGVDIQVQTSEGTASYQEANFKELILPLQSHFEYGILVLKGEVRFQGEAYQTDEMLVLNECQIEKKDGIALAVSGDGHFMLLGGEPLPHKTLIWWNFVDKDVDGLMQSVIDWNAHHPRFGNIDLTGMDLTRLVAPELPAHVKIPNA